jgi:hypothetical protein
MTQFQFDVESFEDKAQKAGKLVEAKTLFHKYSWEYMATNTIVVSISLAITRVINELNL